MNKLKGIAASAGVVITKVLKIESEEIIIRSDFLGAEAEVKAFQDAKAANTAELNKLIEKLSATHPEEAAIFEAHIQLLSDPEIADEVENAIWADKLNAMQSAEKTFNKYVAFFESMDDEYMRERSADLKDLRHKLLARLAGVQLFDLAAIDEEVILVAHDLTPSQTAQLNKKYTLAFATQIGGRTSHSAIMARSLNIPAIVGIENIMSLVNNGDVMALNGLTGKLVINPDQTTLDEYKKAQAEYQVYLKTIQEYKGKPSISKDGHHVELAANIGSPRDMEGVLNNDAEAVGLFRSEFLYMDANNWPDEEFQFKNYADAIKQFNDPKKKTVIRTLDIGGDKTLNYFKFPHEMNPFLGYRAIRLTLVRQDVFKTQLRALIRASQFGKLGIMFPMITNIPEFVAAKNLFEATYKELEAEGVTIGKREDIELGLMIETPAAAVIADKFAKYADFLSIGTNDLIQYTMAADRMNENVSYLYQPLNPSILKLIKFTIDGAHKHGRWVGMCGEMAGDPQAIPVLLGLGLDEFSMSASSVLPARKQIASLEFKKLEKVANAALELEDEEQVKELLKRELNV